MINIHKDTPYSTLYELLADSSAPLVSEYRQELSERKEITPYYEEISNLDILSRQLSPTLSDAPLSSIEYQRASEQYDAIAVQRKRFGHDVLNAVHALQKQSRDFEYDNIVSLSANDPHATMITEYLFEGISTEPNRNAPFAEYKHNSDTKWRYVADIAIRQYLREQQFVHNMPSSADYSGYVVTISRTESDGKAIEVPISSFVHVAGFDSWLGRGINGRGEKRPSTPIARYLSPNERFSSLNTIKNYAATPGDLPPIGHVNTYIQPDGRIFSDNNNGDSHRIAAAMLRGDASIKAKQLSVHVLNTNFINDRP